MIMNKTNERIMRRQIQFILKLNNLTSCQKEIDKLIDEQGIEKVFNNLYRIFCSYGDSISKRKKIMEIMKKIQ